MITVSEPQAAATTGRRAESAITGGSGRTVASGRTGGSGRSGRAGRRRAVAVVVAAAVGLLLAGCAAPAPTPAAAPAPPGPALIGKGTLDAPVTVSTDGPAAFSVRTLNVPPGGSTGWHTHDGTEMSIVTAGEVVVVRADGCAPRTYRAGEAFVIPDSVTHLGRNDGTAPAAVVVGYLLAADAPDRTDAPAAC